MCYFATESLLGDTDRCAEDFGTRSWLRQDAPLQGQKDDDSMHPFCWKFRACNSIFRGRPARFGAAVQTRFADLSVYPGAHRARSIIPKT